jgi:hypothetical protein
VTSPEDPLRADLEWPDPSKPNRGYSYPAPTTPGYGAPSAPPSAGMPYGPPGSAFPAAARSRGPLWLFVIVAILIVAAGVAAWVIWF